MAEINYRSLLETNNYLRNLSDTTYWLCITRTVQESKLFPMNPYMLLSYLNTFYRLPTLLREIDAATPAEELGDRAREVSLKVDTVNAAWGMPAFYLIGREMLMNWGLLGPADAAQDVVDVLDFSRRFNLAYHRRYSDLCYGYNVFWRRHVAALGLDATSLAPEDGGHLWGDGFEVETLIHVRVAKAGLTVAEVPSFEFKRIHGVSNLNATRDGLRVVRTIFAERARSRRHQGQSAPLAAEQAASHANAVEESIG